MSRIININHNLTENNYPSKLDTLPATMEIEDSSGTDLISWAGHGQENENSNVDIILHNDLTPLAGNVVRYTSESYSGNIELISIIGSTSTGDYKIYEVSTVPSLPNGMVEYTFSCVNSPRQFIKYGKVILYEDSLVLIPLYGTFTNGESVKYSEGGRITLNISADPTFVNGLPYYELNSPLTVLSFVYTDSDMSEEISDIKWIQYRNISNKSLNSIS